MNVIGEFDDQGKCDIDRDHNFIIVHPDILLSGTRVKTTCLLNILFMYFGFWQYAWWHYTGGYSQTLL